jgi:UDP-N-acetylmuramyl-tripeptide synthetase
MQNYLDAKMKLFQALGKQTKKDVTAVINVDDPYGKRIMTYIDGSIATYGVYNNANITASGFDIDFDKMSFKCSTAEGDFKISSKMIGVHNAYNIMAAILVAKNIGIDMEIIKTAIEEFDFVPGRLERIKIGSKVPVIVDFAHSPDSIQKLLETLRPLVSGRLILVFGCPGNRDKTKRPIMGELAARLADFVIISTDDPHTEKPDRIISEIEEGVIRAGAKLHKKYIKIEDRRTAITEAIHMAKADDLVVLAGRGHELYQDYNGIKVKIDDREVAREVLVKKR